MTKLIYIAFLLAEHVLRSSDFVWSIQTLQASFVIARVIPCPRDVQRTHAYWTGVVERDFAVDRCGCGGLFRQSAAEESSEGFIEPRE